MLAKLDSVANLSESDQTGTNPIVTVEFVPVCMIKSGGN